MSAAHQHYRAPRECPVCSERLRVTQLGCDACGTGLSGDFESCDFCALDAGDLDVLRVFLTSRGNIKELERHLGVSYPTARARYDDVVRKLGLTARPGGEPEPDLGPAADRLRTFLEQYWGGPTTYSDGRGHPRLRMRHAPYKVNPAARDRWLVHMRTAVDSLDLPPLQHATLWDYLERAAHAMVNTFEE